MDATIYGIDERGSCERSAPRSCVGRKGVPAAPEAAFNLYGREVWEKPQGAGSRSSSGEDLKADRGVLPRRWRSRRAEASGISAAASGVAVVPGGLVRAGRAVWGCRIGRRRWRFRSVLGAGVLLSFVLVAVFQMANLYAEGLGVAGPTASPAADAIPAGLAASDEGGSASTPRDEWRVGQVPFLYQIDPQYCSAPYAGATVEEAGCGPTSLSMVYIALTGKTDKDPVAMAAFSEERGYVEDGLTAWRLMTDGAADLGLVSREVPADAGCLMAELAQGRPVICSVRPGDFTDTGHFLVVAGAADNGELVVHDPNSPANSARTWDVERVLSQCANLWAFDRR